MSLSDSFSSSPKVMLSTSTSTNVSSNTHSCFYLVSSSSDFHSCESDYASQTAMSPLKDLNEFPVGSESITEPLTACALQSYVTERKDFSTLSRFFCESTISSTFTKFPFVSSSSTTSLSTSSFSSSSTTSLSTSSFSSSSTTSLSTSFSSSSSLSISSSLDLIPRLPLLHVASRATSCLATSVAAMQVSTSGNFHQRTCRSLPPLKTASSARHPCSENTMRANSAVCFTCISLGSKKEAGEAESAHSYVNITKKEKQQNKSDRLQENAYEGKKKSSKEEDLLNLKKVKQKSYKKERRVQKVEGEDRKKAEEKQNESAQKTEEKQTINGKLSSSNEKFNLEEIRIFSEEETSLPVSNDLAVIGDCSSCYFSSNSTVSPQQTNSTLSNSAFCKSTSKTFSYNSDSSLLSDIFKNSEFDVCVSTEYLKFSCAHFVAFPGFREKLHGHNYTVAFRVGGPLHNDGYVIDFKILKDTIRNICKSLDGYFIVPMLSEALKITEEFNSINIFCEDGSHFKFPRFDCLCLPIAHSTTEELAAYVMSKIINEMKHNCIEIRFLKWLEVTVSERPNQSVRLTYYFSDRSKN